MQNFRIGLDARLCVSHWSVFKFFCFVFNSLHIFDADNKIKTNGAYVNIGLTVH